MKRIARALRITKVVCTRSVKGQRGDSFVGWSAAHDTIQDDAGSQGVDLISILDKEDTASSFHQALTIKDAKIAGYVLAMQVDIAAHEHAMAGSTITPEQSAVAVRAIKSNYLKLMARVLREGKEGIQ